MTTSKPYDLEERTYAFARCVIELTNCIPRTVANQENGRQLVKASGSVAANYIEAREALSRKDFVMRAKICRKEAKECRLWLRLLEIRESQTDKQRQALADEATELLRIFNAIVEKASQSST